MMKKYRFFVGILLLLLLFPATSLAQQTAYNEYVVASFPVIKPEVSTAGDYFVYMVGADRPTTYNGYVANYMLIRTGNGVVGSTTSNKIQVGLYVTAAGYRWFVNAERTAASDGYDVDCKRGNPQWFDSNNENSGCLSDFGDLGLGKDKWLRVQLVKYSSLDYWIVRIRNFGTEQVADVAHIHAPNPNSIVDRAQTVLHERWFGTQPSDNPWLLTSFYNQDFKYRTANGWAHMPSGIGNNYGVSNIYPATDNNSNPCTHYGVDTYVQDNPYLWFMGTGGSICNEPVYTGGGPDTAVIAIQSVLANSQGGKYLSSENGNNCVVANRKWPGIWEEWHIEYLGNDEIAIRGNTGKYLKRRSNDDLWVESTDKNSNDTKFDEESTGPFDFRLRNIGNNRYADHNSGNGCVEADVSNPGTEENYRFVAW